MAINLKYCTKDTENTILDITFTLRCCLSRYLRAVGYRWLARWLFGYMGPEKTRPLPACIYHDLRGRYDTYNTKGYLHSEERN